MLEKDFLRQVINYAKLRGWKIAHFGASVRIVGKERTFVGDKDASGFPDLVLVRGDSIMFVELKAEKGRISQNQVDWLAALDGAGADTWLWRPSDWDIIESILK